MLSYLHSLIFRRAVSGPPRRAPHTGGRRSALRRWYQTWLEALEDRTVPSTADPRQVAAALGDPSTCESHIQGAQDTLFTVEPQLAGSGQNGSGSGASSGSGSIAGEVASAYGQLS